MLRKRSRKKISSKMAHGSRGGVVLENLWRHLSDLGDIWDPAGFRMGGSRNIPFFNRVNIKQIRMRSRRGVLKTHEKMLETQCQQVRFWNPKTELWPDTCYKTDLFGGPRNAINNRYQSGYPNLSNMGQQAPRTTCFDVLLLLLFCFSLGGAAKECNVCSLLIIYYIL